MLVKSLEGFQIRDFSSLLGKWRAQRKLKPSPLIVHHIVPNRCKFRSFSPKEVLSSKQPIFGIHKEYQRTWFTLPLHLPNLPSNSIMLELLKPKVTQVKKVRRQRRDEH